MSLPSVEWRYVGTNSATSATINIVMDNIYALATGTTYIDGSPRSQGSGSAGTWNRYQTPGGITEAIYVTPPSGDQKIIIAGSSGTFTPTMASPDTYTTNTLMVNVTKNPGNFSTWDAANPFTSGNAFGYWKFLGSRTGSGGITNFSGNIYLYESKESIAVFLISSTTNSSTSYSNGCIAGALWDSESNSSADAETDGRLYGLITSGHFNPSYASVWSSAGGIWSIDLFNNVSLVDGSNEDSFIIRHSAADREPHIGVFTTGSSTIRPADLMMYPLTANSSSSLVTPSGKFARIPLLYRLTSSSQMLGRLREISLCQRGLIGQRHMNGSNTVGYVVSCSDYAPTPADAILLEY